MSRNGKVIVAMSGGVDSSVAACLLKEQGYHCVAVFMRVGAPEEGTDGRRDEPTADASGRISRTPLSTVPPRRLKHGCCSVEDALDARAIAGRLGIPFYVLNFQADFDAIISYFVDEYARARTPNPCVLCNTRLKFGKLLRYADLVDAEFVATGHYARRFKDRLARARHLPKDQSYVLFGIARDALPRCLFPIGELAEKAAVRRIAADLGLKVHDKPDSQEICFVPDGDYKALVRARRPDTRQPGEVCDSAGRVLATHEGVANFTIGQRHGLGIAAGRPVYVTRLDGATNRVTVGSRTELCTSGLTATDLNWLTDPPPPREWRRAAIKIRHTHTPAPGRFRVTDDGPHATVEAQFDEPQLAVTPGQAAVFYDGDIVLGGGWIE